MEIYSENLKNIIECVDNTLYKLEQTVRIKDIEIGRLNDMIEEMQENRREKMQIEYMELFDSAFSDNIRVEGLGVSGARLVKKLRECEQILNMKQFLNDLGL
jgi:hypothetical protein